jgi:hypothetical protein
MRDLLSKLNSILAEETTLQDLKTHPAANDPTIQKAIADKEQEESKKEEQQDEDLYQIGDEFGISFSEDFEIAATITDILEDGVVIELDETAINYLQENGLSFIDVQIDEDKKKGLDGKACWKGYRRMGTKMKGGKRVDNCVKVGEDSEKTHKGGTVIRTDKGLKHYGKPGDYWKDDNEDRDDDKLDKATIYRIEKATKPDDIDEAKYQGREVPLGKPMAGDVKKSKVYVKNPQGNVVKVNFGDKKMKIKKSNPKRRKSFRARHNCDNPGPRHKARYWSCRAW